MKNYYVISGFNLHENNRGTAALGYGVFTFLKDRYNTGGLTAIKLVLYKKPWKFHFKTRKNELLEIADDVFAFETIYIWFLDYLIYKHLPILGRFTKTARTLKKVSFVAAINGGDGFSDIYGTKTFLYRLFDTNLAMREQIPLIILPQTLGPFKEIENYNTAVKILKYATKVYVRDLKFETELKKMGVQFEITKDLSFYMKPEKINIDILPNAVGINVSGLCYSNKFRDLTAKFEAYPQLIESIIQYFQEKNVPIYLIAHSYNYNNPEEANDDMLASKQLYESLSNKTNVFLIDRNLTSPQTKYVISQFKFFVGTRMHANFAAIFTETPVFGLAYSYKYEGAFNYMGLNRHYANILEIIPNDINEIIYKIDSIYKENIN